MIQTIENADQGEDVPVRHLARPDRAGWLSGLEAIGEDAGYFQTLGSRHWAFFSDESPVLLVTFETVADIRNRKDGLPMGYALAREHGWSTLCLIADGDTWYRDASVYRYFDRLVDDAFFEDFDRVVFFGASMGAHAACAFSVAAPGATVLALTPVATLDPALTGWDGRYARQRRLTFTDRYGYAPDMTDGAGDVFVVFDPAEPLDAMHAALFDRPHVTALRARRVGPGVERALEGMQILFPLITAACEGHLDAPLFQRLFRKRRSYGPYLDRLMGRLEQIGRYSLAELALKSVLSRAETPHTEPWLAALAGRGMVMTPGGRHDEPLKHLLPVAETCSDP